MSEGVPVLIHLRGETFRKLERLAEQKGVGVRPLIEAHIERGLQPVKDGRSKGTPAPGRIRPWVRLTPEQVAELRELNRMGWTLLELANRFGCSVGTITNWRKRFADEEAGNA